MRRACAGSNASYSDAGRCVFRLSVTSTTFSAPSCTSSTSQRITSAESLAVRPHGRADFVAVYVTMSAHGAADLLDTSKACVLRMLRRHEKAWVSVLFGMVVIGRPEPS